MMPAISISKGPLNAPGSYQRHELGFFAVAKGRQNGDLRDMSKANYRVTNPRLQ